MSEQFADDQLVVLTINDDKDTEKIQKAVDKVGTSLPILHDKGSVTVDAYNAYALPTLYLLDKEHVVNQVWMGSVQDKTDQLVKQIKSVLESGSVSSEIEEPAAE